MSGRETIIPNGGVAGLDGIRAGGFSELRTLILEKTAGGARLAALFPFRRGERTLLLAVMALQENREITLAAAAVGDSFPSLARECHAAHLFEREIAEQWGIVPLGNPWLKPIRFQRPPRGRADPRLPEAFRNAPGPGVMDYFRVEGEDVHEVAVGPVHAGVIEPGHFRFQCHGEKVMFLEIALGYQHRGIEKALVGGPDVLTRHRLETAAGDSSCGHALAHAMTTEALAGLDVPEAAHRIRGAALELERLANHVGDLGALSGDVGYLPTASYCGRLRGDILNLTARICGNRFGRGLIAPGGVGRRLDAAARDAVLSRLDPIQRDVRGAIGLLFRAPSVLARFENTGTLPRALADHFGMVGPAARASGLAVDVRLGLPHGPYSRELFTLELGANGDVMDRARQRRGEIEVSFRLAREWLDGLPPVAAAGRERPNLRPDSVAVALVEGWRGQICHAAVTDSGGRYAAYKVVDPSFLNWIGLALAMRGQQISDFPLCNKSFNLSYCGHDL